MDGSRRTVGGKSFVESLLYIVRVADCTTQSRRSKKAPRYQRYGLNFRSATTVAQKQRLRYELPLFLPRQTHSTSDYRSCLPCVP